MRWLAEVSSGSRMSAFDPIADVGGSSHVSGTEQRRVRIISDFRMFERPPKPSAALFRWIAWRWLVLGSLFTCFVMVMAAMHFVGGEPIYYTNEDRYLSDAEVWDMVWLFLSGGGLFVVLGLLGVLFIPKR